jgi:hypothetical protein
MAKSIASKVGLVWALAAGGQASNRKAIVIDKIIAMKCRILCARNAGESGAKGLLPKSVACVLWVAIVLQKLMGSLIQ